MTGERDFLWCGAVYETADERVQIGHLIEEEYGIE